MELLRGEAASATILFPLITRGSQDFKVGGITFVAADTQISKDEGAFANTTNLPVHEGNGMYSLALTPTEMTAQRIMVTCIDSATKLWEDQAIVIITFGSAFAYLGIQLFDTETPANVTQINSVTAAATKLQVASESMVTGSVDTTAFTPTTTEFETSSITEATANHYKDRVVIFTGLTGGLAEQAKDITAYSLVGGRGHFTVTALTEAPINAQEFIIV